MGHGCQSIKTRNRRTLKRHVCYFQNYVNVDDDDANDDGVNDDDDNDDGVNDDDDEGEEERH